MTQELLSCHGPGLSDRLGLYPRWIAEGSALRGLSGVPRVGRNAQVTG